MRRRRKTSVRRVRARSPIARYSRRRKSSSSKMGFGKILQLDAMAYGAIRGYTSNLLTPLTSKIPLGDIADEVVMAGACWLGSKYGSGFVRNVAQKGLIIENARVGEAVVSGGLGSFTNNSTPTGQSFVYG